jgi:transporter family-2 protein
VSLQTPLLALAAALAGCGLAFQAAVNAQMRAFVSHPLVAALASFAIGTGALAVLAGVAMLAGAPRPAMARVLEAPWWVWVGGLLGAYYIFTTVTVTTRLGPAVFLALVIAGQLVTAVAIEHAGALGVARQPVSAGRIAGVALMVLGVVLLRRF